MRIRKQNVGRILKVTVFLAVLFLLFLFFTYLMRNTDYNGRQNILNFYEEETELDVVFVGASSIYRYWDPMVAWEAEGIATANYSVSSMHLATYLSGIKDILRTQKPELIVLEVRKFCRASGEDPGISAGARNMLDSLDFGISRMEAVHYYCEKMDLSWEEALSLYLDLIQYHDNYEALTTKLNWQLADNRTGTDEIEKQTYKGYAISSDHTAYEDPSTNLSEEKKNPNANSLMLYEEILEYCQENEIQILPIVVPMVITEEESMEINALEDLTESQGVPFLDMNLYYDEMQIDFSTDFYDPHHVNILGADKMTAYLAEYIAEEYDLEDHRNDPAYASWHQLYEEYSAMAEKARAEVREKAKTE